MSQLILLRHGMSAWNKENIFTGWVDIPLSPEGEAEARQAAKMLEGISIEHVFCSTLLRALQTALIVVGQLSKKIPCIIHEQESLAGRWERYRGEHDLLIIDSHWCLNERMYGDLQGRNKEEVMKEYGKDQVHRWRRSWKEAPPGGESLEVTAHRVIPYFRDQIVPRVEQGEHVLVTAHGNSLRAIVAEIGHLKEEEILELEIPTGRPLIYTLRGGSFEQEHTVGNQ